MAFPKEINTPAWHRCGRWWKEKLACPYHREPEEAAEEDDDDDEDRVPVLVPIPVKDPEPLVPKKVAVELEIPEPVKIVEAVAKIPEPVEVADPRVVTRSVPAGQPSRSVTVRPAGHGVTTRTASKAARVRAMNQVVKDSRARDNARTIARNLGRKLVRKDRFSPWILVNQVIAIGAGSLGAGTKGPRPPGPSARAELMSTAVVAESWLARDVGRSSARGRLRREQREAVEEAGRIAQGARNRARARQKAKRARALAYGVAAASATAAAATAIYSGGGRGGGFHRQASTFRGGRGDLGARVGF